MNVASRLEDRTLATRSARMAALLAARGVTVGSVVALMVPAGPELAIAFYGALRVGAVVAPLDSGLDASAVRRRLERLTARLLVAWHGCAEAAEDGAALAGTDVVFVAPGEFERLLAGAPPRRAITDRAGDDVAVVLDGGRRLTHADLARAAEPLAVLA